MAINTWMSFCDVDDERRIQCCKIKVTNASEMLVWIVKEVLLLHFTVKILILIEEDCFYAVYRVTCNRWWRGGWINCVFVRFSTSKKLNHTGSGDVSWNDYVKLEICSAMPSLSLFVGIVNLIWYYTAYNCFTAVLQEDPHGCHVNWFFPHYSLGHNSEIKRTKQ